MDSLIAKINELIWPPLWILIFICGLYFTIKMKGLQFTKFTEVFKLIFGKSDDHAEKKEDDENKEISFSPWQAVATSLSGAVGTGNIIGVGCAVLTGGPGSIFWLWVVAFLGMILKYAEIVLAMKYRVRNEQNELCGGPMFYMRDGLKNTNIGKKLAIVFATLIIILSFASGNIVQINSITTAFKNIFPIPNIEIIIGSSLAILFVFIIISGTKGIGKISEIMTPIFCGGYMIASFIVIIYNYQNIPVVFWKIFREAFNFKSVAGGAFGYSILSAMRYGIARGVGAGEIGIGTAPIAHGSSKEKDPYKQGLFGIFEIFISCFVVCTLTGIVLLIHDPSIADRYNNVLLNFGIDGLEKMDNCLALLTNSFSSIMGIKIANFFMLVCIFLFAFTTVIGMFYYGVRSYEFIFGHKTSYIYKGIFLLLILVGPFLAAQVVWEINDLINGVLLLANLSTVFLLRNKIFKRDL